MLRCSVKGKNREDICQNVSDLLAEMLDIVELELDGFTHHFQGYLEKSTHRGKSYPAMAQADAGTAGV